MLWFHLIVDISQYHTYMFMDFAADTAEKLGGQGWGVASTGSLSKWWPPACDWQTWCYSFRISIAWEGRYASYSQLSWWGGAGGWFWAFVSQVLLVVKITMWLTHYRRFFITAFSDFKLPDLRFFFSFLKPGVKPSPWFALTTWCPL